MQNSILIRISTLYLVPGTLYFSISKFFNRRSAFGIRKVTSNKYQVARLKNRDTRDYCLRYAGKWLVKDLSIPLRLCVFARIIKTRRSVILRGRLQSRQGLSTLGSRSKVYFNPISIVFPIYFTKRSGVYFNPISIVFSIYFTKRSGVYLNSISIVFLFISRSEVYFYFISIVFPVRYFVPGTLYNPRYQVRITN